MEQQTTQNAFSENLERLQKGIASFLIAKNTNYGNSALEPLHVFAPNLNDDLLIGTRIDDKLSRIKNCKTLRKNDVVDLLGYLHLLCMKKGWFDFEELID